MIQRDILFKVLDSLDALEIPYMIIGAFASNYWGRPRMTHDADLLVEIPPAKAATLARALQSEFYSLDPAIEQAARLKGRTKLIHTEQAFQVDLWMPQDAPYDRERFGRRGHGTMFDRQVWITSVEDTILSKLLWYRSYPASQRQFDDALEVYEIQQPYLDLAYLERWAGNLGLTDLLAQVRKQAALPLRGA